MWWIMSRLVARRVAISEKRVEKDPTSEILKETWVIYKRHGSIHLLSIAIEQKYESDHFVVLFHK